MVRSTVKKVMWVGRATVFMVGLAVILALVVGVVTRAGAHSGNPGLFHLNHNNPVTALSTLTGTLADAVLKVDNNGTGPALSLEAGTGSPPLSVNSEAGTATGLSADELDGKDESAFLGANGKAADSEQLDGQDSTAFSLADHNHDSRYYTETESDARYLGKTEKAADSELLDGKNSSDFASAYKRTVVVSPVPGDPVASGAALKQALANLASSGNPSENNPFLLKIEPGIYNVGDAPNGSNNGLVMRPWVDIEGSGEGVTTITAAGNDALTRAQTVTPASNAELRSLTVKNTGGADVALAISASVSPIRLTNVTASASGGNGGNLSVLINGAATVQLREVTAIASGSGANTGVYNAGTVTLTDVTTDVTGGTFANGIYNSTGTTQVHHSEIAGSDQTIFNHDGSVLVGASQLDGGAAFSRGTTMKCVASYDENYNALSDSCV